MSFWKARVSKLFRLWRRICQRESYPAYFLTGSLFSHFFVPSSTHPANWYSPLWPGICNSSDIVLGLFFWLAYLVNVHPRVSLVASITGSCFWRNYEMTTCTESRAGQVGRPSFPSSYLWRIRNWSEYSSLSIYLGPNKFPYNKALGLVYWSCSSYWPRYQVNFLYYSYTTLNLKCFKMLK